jgi:AcrR family transcriptional regulator
MSEPAVDDAVTPAGAPSAEPERVRRVDARRNQETLLDAAARVFVRSGVDAPVREVATEAGVGVGTVYRHFPKRADLVLAVYRHQVEACAEAGPRLLSEASTPEVALREWIGLFVDFLVTKHGLPDALHGDGAGTDTLHRYFVDRLVPVCGDLLDAARADPAEAGDPDRVSVSGYELLRGVGNLCIGTAGDRDFDVDRVVQAYVTGALAGVPVSPR